MTLTVGSTFTGVGGADLGLERAGMQIVWQCELDAWKRSVLAKHWPDVHIYPDITTLDNPPAIDMLIGGFPCQDLSVAGKRKGFNGERSVLAFEFLRLAESLRPCWLLMENVPGLLSSNGGRDLARLLDELGTIGYGWAYRILDARYFGVPQRRRRIFIVARRTDPLVDTRAAAKLALRALWEGSSGDPTPGWPPRENTPTSVGAGASGRGIVGTHGDVESSVTGTLTRMYLEQSGQDYAGGAGVIAQPVAEPISFYPTGGSQNGFWDVTGVSPTLKVGSGVGASSGNAIAYPVAHGVSASDDQVAGTLCTNSQGGQRTTDIAGAYVSHAIPVQDGRAINKNQNGLGIGIEGDPAYTLDRTGAQSVAQITSAFKAGQGASAGSIGYEEEMAPTLTAAPSGSNQVPTIHTAQTFSVYPEGGNGAQAGHLIPFDTNFSNQATPGGDVTQTLDTRGRQEVAQAFAQNQRDEVRDLGSTAGALAAQPGMKQQTFLREQMSVRRLTPIECERLMGWPDNWTAPDGIKAPDSKRYAACGDGIVSWCAYWIGQRIQMIENEGHES